MSDEGTRALIDLGAQILAELRGLREDARGARPAASGGGGAARATGGTGARAATAQEMSGEKGDPVVKWDPPRWKKSGKPSEAGSRLSECSADYLDAVADFADFKADRPMPGKEQYVESDRHMAALARGWAGRRRGNVSPPPAENWGGMPDGPPGEDEAPF